MGPYIVDSETCGTLNQTINNSSQPAMVHNDYTYYICIQYLFTYFIFIIYILTHVLDIFIIIVSTHSLTAVVEFLFT